MADQDLLTICVDSLQSLPKMLENLKKLIDFFKIPQKVNMTDYLFLKLSISCEQTKIAELLLKGDGARVNTLPTDIGLTPLALAFEKEYTDISSILMTKGASIYVKHDTKTTVLHKAAERRSLKMVKLAVDKGIDVNLLDNKGESALQILLKMSNLEYSNENEKKDMNDMIKVLLEKGASVDFNGRTALHYAVKFKDADITRFVLDSTEKVNVCDAQGNTALDVLLARNDGNDDEIFKIWKLIVEKGADINISNSQGKKFSHIAAEKKYLRILNDFLERQCEVCTVKPVESHDVEFPNLWHGPQFLLCKDNEDNTVLHSLLKESAGLEQKEVSEEREEKNPFMRAVDKILSVECFPDMVNIQNLSGKTPLHLAADCYHYKIIEEMLPKFENVNVRDFDRGESLLHILVRTFSISSIDIIKCLLERGADVDLQNEKGDSSLDLGNKKRNKKLLQLLETVRPSNNLDTLTDAVDKIGSEHPSPLHSKNKRSSNQIDVAEQSARKKQRSKCNATTSVAEESARKRWLTEFNATTSATTELYLDSASLEDLSDEITRMHELRIDKIIENLTDMKVKIADTPVVFCERNSIDFL